MVWRVSMSSEAMRAVGSVLDAARAGHPQTLVALGVKGAGKSHLVDEASRLAGERAMLVLSTRGTVGDRDVVFGGLHALLRPVEDELEVLVPEHAGTLRETLSVRGGVIGPMAVRLAIFRLLCACSARGPVCLLADDVDLLDRGTADALSFALSRMAVDPVAAIVTAEERPVHFDGSVVMIEPLIGADIAALLRDRGLASGPAELCARAARGNPGMAVAMASGLSTGQRSGREPLPPMPRPDIALLRRYDTVLASLDDAVRRSLVVVAADGAGSIREVRAALALLGEPSSGLDEAEAAGIVEIDGPRVRFRDQWISAAAYHLVAPASRRAAHRALAESYGRPDQAVARAWQLASSSDGPSDRVAEALAQVAADTARRGGSVAAVNTYRRAADLAESPDLRERLMLDALQQAVESLDLEQAELLARRLEPMTADAEIAVDDVLALCGVQDHAWGREPTTAPGDGRWQRRRDGRLAREDAARGGRHAEVLADRSTSFHAHAQLSIAQAHRHAGRLLQAREVLTGVQALARVAAPQVVAVADLLHADLDLLSSRLEDCRERLAAATPAAGPGWPQRLAGWISHRLEAASGGPMSPWVTPFATDAASAPLAGLRSTMAEAVLRADASALSTAVGSFERLELWVDAAECRVALAEVLAATAAGVDLDEGRDAAVRALSRLGVTVWNVRVRPPAVDTRSSASAGDPVIDAGLSRLSRSEMRVAEAVASGMTNREAAAVLFLSVKTIDFHLQQMYRKLGVRSRTELAVRMAARAQPSMERIDR